MNRFRHLRFLFSLLAGLAFLPAFAAPEPPPPPEPPAHDQPVVDAPAVADAPAPADIAAPDDAGAEMRELVPAAAEDAPKSTRKSRRTRSYDYDVRHDQPPFGSHRVPTGERWREVVSLFGDSVVDGTVARGAVSVMGNTTVNGRVGGEAVSVLGTTTVNGTVAGEVVAVLGDVVLGPQAVVEGNIVTVLGQVVRSDGARVTGRVQEVVSFGPFGNFEWLRTWVTRCLFWGRPLAFGENLGWAWMVAGAFLVFYLLLALVFPRAIDRCVENLEQRPGGTFLAAVLAVLLSPVLFVLLAITGVGLVLVPFIAAGFFFAGLFGKAAVFAWLGRRLTGLGGWAPPAVVAVLVGGVLVGLLYTIPFLGFLLSKLFGVLGLGMVVYTVALSMKSNRPPRPVPAAPAPGFAAASAAAGEPPAAPAPAAPLPPFYAAAAASPAAVPAAAFDASTLPRAGFWIRLGASLLDFLLIGIATALLDNLINLSGPGFLFVVFATYCVILWKHKGTTIGGIICGLKVVRLDDRPLDWGVAVVRALTAFLSFFAVGLGFIWVAFDDEKQSWHDKVAGTTIVKVPKGTALI